MQRVPHQRHGEELELLPGGSSHGTRLNKELLAELTIRESSSRNMGNSSWLQNTLIDTSMYYGVEMVVIL